MQSYDVARLRRLTREGGWIVLGQVLAVAGALALVRVLTEYLTPVQYGQLALGLTVASLVNAVLMGGIAQGVGRYYSVAAEVRDLGGYLRSARLLVGAGSLAVLAFALLLAGTLVGLGHSRWLGLTAAVLVLALLGGLNSTLSGIQNAARQRSIVAFHGGLDAWLRILLAVAVIHWLGTSTTVVVIGYCLSALLVTGSQLVYLRRTIPPSRVAREVDRRWTGAIWRYSWPFSAWGIFTWMQQVSDRWALEAFGTTQDVGLYAVVFQLGYGPITIIVGMSMAFLAPILYQAAGDAQMPARNARVHTLTWRITAVAMGVTAIAFVATLGLHGLLFRILVAPEYREMSYLLPWVLLAGGLFAAGQALSLKLMSEMKSMTLLAPKVITALLGVGLNVVGAWIAGVHGLVAGLVLFSSIYLAWMIVLGRCAPQPSRELGNDAVH